jgi:hypothetical protein
MARWFFSQPPAASPAVETDRPMTFTSTRPMTDRENQRLAILSFIDTHPGTEAGQIGVALAPAGTPNQRTWAVANIAPIR